MKLVSKSLADQVYDAIKDGILSGKFPCGSKISEDMLASHFEVSRTPIREALRRLSTYGLIQMEPRCHSSVISLTPKEEKDIAEFRLYIESFALSTLNKKKLESSLEELCRASSSCQYALGIGDRAKAFELDSLFHTTLVSLSDNSAVIDVYERLDAKIQLLRLSQNESNEDLINYLMQHATLIELLKNNKIDEAKTLLRDHIFHDGKKGVS